MMPSPDFPGGRRRALEPAWRGGCWVPVLLLAITVVPVRAAPITLARLKYGGGGDWYASPTSLPNLIRAVNQRTSLRLAPQPATVEAVSARLFDYPIVVATGHGRIVFTDPERADLRRYLLNGGFLYVDDNYGLDEYFRPQVRKVFPDIPLVELPFSHAIYHSLYPFNRGLPKIHEHHGGPPHGYAIISKGRVVLFYSYNTDIINGCENHEVYNDPLEKHEAALRTGVNIVLYALTH